jgi:hypothetical protein
MGLPMGVAGLLPGRTPVCMAARHDPGEPPVHHDPAAKKGRH